MIRVLLYCSPTTRCEAARGGETGEKDASNATTRHQMKIGARIATLLLFCLMAVGTGKTGQAHRDSSIEEGVIWVYFAQYHILRQTSGAFPAPPPKPRDQSTRSRRAPAASTWSAPKTEVSRSSRARIASKASAG